MCTITVMRDLADMMQRAIDAKQALLIALRHSNIAALDGSRDEADLGDLAIALDQVLRAKDHIECLHHRVEFHVHLEQVRIGVKSDSSQRELIALVRLGVEGGYAIEDVRAMVDEVRLAKPE